jgi:hypothetical protein
MESAKPFQQPELDEHQSRRIDPKAAKFDDEFKLYGVVPMENGRWGCLSATIGRDGKVKGFKVHYQLEEEKDFAMDNLKKELSQGLGVRY